jgi:glycosyltransferase involved in cell wall biosynthesis
MRSLVLFSELYSSLRKGERFGQLERNMRLFERFLELGRFHEVLFFSYDPSDHEKLAELHSQGKLAPGIRVLTPPAVLATRLGSLLYSLIGPLIHRRAMSQAEVLRTHQVSGSWTALIAKLLYRKPLLFRVGYPLSPRFRDENKPIHRALALMVEMLLTRKADHIAVTSRTMRRLYMDLSGGRDVTVLPNYADVSGFTQIANYDASRPVLYVGRLEPEKNVGNLIRACALAGVPLTIYGRGSLETELRALAHDCQAEVRFMGVVPNSALMRIHHDHAVFALCSPREGMPKALIEAMASGLICIGTDTEGINELIADGETGYLIPDTAPESIARVLKRVIANPDPAVGRRARELVCNTLSLEHAVRMELEIIDRITRNDVGADTAPGPVRAPGPGLREPSSP